MSELQETLKLLPGLSDITLSLIMIIVIVWLINKFLDKSQEKDIMHNEQIDKYIKIIVSDMEYLLEIINLVKEVNDRSAHISTKLDEANKKLDQIQDMQKENYGRDIKRDSDDS